MTTSGNLVRHTSSSATPFTVNKLNSNTKLDTAFRLSDSYYDAKSFGNGWEYQCPTAPRPEPHVSQVFASQSGTIPATKASGVGFDFRSQPTQCSYSPSVSGDHSMNLPSELPPQFASTLFKFEAGGPQKVDSVGFHDGKRAKRVEKPAVVFSAVEENNGDSKSYRNHFSGGTYKTTADSCGNSCFPTNKDLMENSTSSFLKCDGRFNREACTLSGSERIMDEKFSPEVNNIFSPYYFDVNRNVGSRSTYPRTGTSEMDAKFGDFSTNHVNGCDLDAKCVWSARPVPTAMGSS